MDAVRMGLATLCVMMGLTASAADKQQLLQKREAFFREAKVRHLAFELSTKAVESLRREPRKYVKATLKEGDRVYNDVAIHLRGSAGSFRHFDDKPGLTINMDKYADDQSFHGLDKFHLANSVQDPSYLSEWLCGEMFRAAGVPASRIGHAVVTLNGKVKGFYYLKEGYDKEFLELHFKNRNGNLYDGGFLTDIDRPLQLLSGKGDVPDQQDLKALVVAAREPDRAKRFQKMEQVLDMDRFLSFLAMDTIIWDWDGYAMKPNNYRLYHDPKRNTMVLIPSGMDQMFTDMNAPILPGFQGLLARKLVDTTEGKKRYLERVDHLLRNVIKPDELIQQLDAMAARIQPELAKVDAGAGRDHKNHVHRLRNALRERPKKVQDQLQKLTASSQKG